eukprot:TRINITY_DN2956_c0_g1_i3.p1 TRINITY_DN2956_c0_g1~~TRINITY_DN2956_c0_g1_i3.p1  ORF type:complete len:323 (-),score=85.66 TRINITY_DN2956_c0_g1_i3:1119-2048(-)
MQGPSSSRKKVLLMGRSNSGKTSMRSIIFANYVARDTLSLAATIDVEHSHIRFLGNLTLNLWDCGGQELWFEQYFTGQRDLIFRSVEVLVFVMDVTHSDFERDMEYYRSCIEAIEQNSPTAKIFVLLHKCDLIQLEDREMLVQKELEIKKASLPLFVNCFRTSIWDESLFKAWSSIIYSMVPNVQIWEKNLIKFCDICEADEVLLFERATFLVISHIQLKNRNHPANSNHIEKLSSIIKHFRLSCSKFKTHFQDIYVQNEKFSVFLSLLTNSTYIMLMFSDPSAVCSWLFFLPSLTFFPSHFFLQHQVQ